MNELPPLLPNHISSNGQEIWDWAHSLAAWSGRQQQIRELRHGIADLRPLCGSCTKWMCSSLCPREQNVSGRNRGPSMNDLPCDKFEEKGWVTALRSERQGALAALLSPPPAPARDEELR